MRASLLAVAIFSGVLLMPRPWIEAQVEAQATPPFSPSDKLPTFEVATVKPNKSGTNFIRFQTQPGGRFNAENVPVRELLRFAFQLQPYQIEGGPGWITSDRFDVIAKAEGEQPPLGPGQVGPIQLMMRSLLAERFGLVYHTATKEMPIFALMLARPDGKLGPKLTTSTTDCAALFAARRGGGPGGPPGPPPPPGLGEKVPCGFRVSPGNMAGGSSPISQLAQFLSQSMGRPVIDKTGLAGNFDFEVSFTPDQLPPQGVGGPPPGVPPPPPVDPNGPSLQTALQEQLGLKLDSQRGPVAMFVIDKIEQPTPD
jgi:uncharacterized protein (TIGR03435 family)